jgi:hypothetical protein
MERLKSKRAIQIIQMKYKCTGCPALTINCDYTFEWEDRPYNEESYQALPQEHKDHLIANKHQGFLKIE